MTVFTCAPILLDEALRPLRRRPSPLEVPSLRRPHSDDPASEGLPQGGQVPTSLKKQKRVRRTVWLAIPVKVIADSEEAATLGIRRMVEVLGGLRTLASSAGYQVKTGRPRRLPLHRRDTVPYEKS